MFRPCCRRFSFRAKDLAVARCAGVRELPSLKGVQFGQIFSPHMLEVDAVGGAWGSPRIREFGPVTVPAQCAALNYGVQCYEGLKAYKDAGGRTRLFRPEMNAARMQSSMARLCLPAFDAAELLECVKALVRLDEGFVPRERGYSLYIRPVAIGTNENLRIGPADRCKLFVITSPVGPYYPDGFKPVNLVVHTEAKRAWPGGTGGFKLGANYAGPILHQTRCPPKYPQILWLGQNDVVDEVGSMNFMVLWRDEASGELELATAPLDGTILPGITRDSVLALVRRWGTAKVAERRFTIHDLTRALEQRRVVEMFGCGTAAIVTQVSGILVNGRHYDVPLGELSVKLLDTLQGIQYGDIPDPWSVVI